MKKWTKWVMLLMASVMLTACTDEDAPKIAPGANQEENKDSSKPEESDLRWQHLTWIYIILILKLLEQLY